MSIVVAKRSRLSPNTLWLKIRGFTLIELLVVLVIVSLLSSVAIISINSVVPKQDRVEHAHKLERIVQRMREQALLDIRTYGLTITSKAVQYWSWSSESGWQPLQSHRLLPAVEFGSDASFEIFRANESLAIEEKKEEPDSLLTDQSILAEEAETVIHIAAYPDGTISPFEVLIYPENENQKYSLTGSIGGNMIIVDER